MRKIPRKLSTWAALYFGLCAVFIAAQAASKADLRLDGGSATAGTRAPGESISVGWTETNAGSETLSTAYTVRISLLESADDSSSQTLAEFSGSVPLAPGQSRAFVESISLPADLPDGVYFIRIELDATGAIGESNESNNVFTTPTAQLLVESDIVPQPDWWEEGSLELSAGWVFLEWFGAFNPNTVEGFIYHDPLGWLFVGNSVSQDNLWAWDADLGWLWTNEDNYPFFYQLREDRFLFFDVEASDLMSGRFFADVETGDFFFLPFE